MAFWQALLISFDEYFLSSERIPQTAYVYKGSTLLDKAKRMSEI